MADPFDRVSISSSKFIQAVRLCEERLLFLCPLQCNPYGSAFAALYVAASLVSAGPTLNRLGSINRVLRHDLRCHGLSDSFTVTVPPFLPRSDDRVRSASNGSFLPYQPPPDSGLFPPGKISGVSVLCHSFLIIDDSSVRRWNTIRNRAHDVVR